ncbi:MAG: Gfo/Idh/MocA family oxidoreductase [Treponema sp.]|nr:Gfo/Idh/MocA family oxidoreductase [Treponema sp.]
MKIGILGAGRIADVMARTVAAIPDHAELYAIASRSLDRAREFAQKHSVPKAYGSYEELLSDPQVDLVYVATPHSEHYANMKMCISHKKAVLCEKAFTRNAAEAREILDLAKKEKVFVTEAIWTRYMPSRAKIREIIDSGIIGTPDTLTANLHYSIADKERMVRPELAGGALLDLGVYSLNFAMMVFGTDIREIRSNAVLTDTGVDRFNSMTLVYSDGKIANLSSGFTSRSDRQGVIYGTKGYAIVENINNPQSISVFNAEDQLLQKVQFPQIATGYEYEVLESELCLEEGKLQSPSMPHEETLRVMKVMDGLRKEWGVVYPGE